MIPPEPSYALWKETLPVAGKFRFHCPGDDGVGVGVGWVGDVDDGVGDGDGDGDGVGVGDVDDGGDVEDTHLRERLMLWGERLGQSRLASQINFNKHHITTRLVVMMTILMINVKAMVSFKKTSPPPPPYDKDANYDYGNDFDYDHYDNDYDYHCNDYDYDYNYDYHDLLFPPPPPVVLPPIQVDAPGNDLSLYHDQYVSLMMTMMMLNMTMMMMMTELMILPN